MADTTSSRPGNIKINSFKITNYNQTETAEIGFIVLEFEVVEDMASPILRARAVIEDSLSLLTRLPIVGGEQVAIDFITPVETDGTAISKPFQHTFIVTAVKHVHDSRAAMRSEVFILEMASPQILPARSRRVVKAYENMPISQMVQSICKDYLNIDSTKLVVEPSVGERNWVVPNQAPFEIINILASEAKNDSKISNYVFYADREKWNFVTIEKLKTSGSMVPNVLNNTALGNLADAFGGTVQNVGNTLNYNINVIDEEYFFTEQNIPNGQPSQAVANTSLSVTQSGVSSANGQVATFTFNGGQKPPEFRRITDYRIPQLFDIEQGLMKGLYDNSIIEVDPFSQIIQTKQLNYFKQFDEFGHIYEKEKHKVIPDNSPLKNAIGESHQRVIITDKYTAEQDKTIKARERQDFIMHRISSLAQLDQLTLIMVIPGDSDRKPGNTIRVRIPEFGATDDVLKERNKYISGKYLITSVKHKYNREVGYYCHMACVKDVYEAEISDSPGKIAQGSGVSTATSLLGSVNSITQSNFFDGLKSFTS